MKSAETEGLDRLYHYQPFDLDRLRPIICDRQIYFSKPTDFNDPWDCKPYFNSACLSDRDTLERHVAWYVTITRRHRPDISEPEIQRRAAELRSNPGLLRSKIHGSSFSMAIGISERYRVYCLSTKPDCELMWAHYANKHQGICLEFALPNSVLNLALKVSYSKIYPFFDITDSRAEHNLMPLLSKSAAWAYEDEYRLVAQERDTATPHDTLITQGGILQLPEGSLKTVIAGCIAPDTTIAAIKRLVEDAGYPIQFKCATRAPDQYKLDIV